MPLKIRKFASALALKLSVAVVSPLLLSACALLEQLPSPIPPVSVADVTKPPPNPDTPPLYCRIGHGTALFGRDWYDFEDVDFQIYRGKPADINLSRIHGEQQMTIQALFDGSGQKLIFCPFLTVAPGANAAPAPDQRISCASLYALEDDLRDGIKRTFDIPAAVRGGAITCAYTPEKLRSLKLPAGSGN